LCAGAHELSFNDTARGGRVARSLSAIRYAARRIPMSLAAVIYVAAIGLVLAIVIWRLAIAHSRLTGEGAEGRRFSRWGSYPSDSSSSGSHHGDAGHH